MLNVSVIKTSEEYVNIIDKFKFIWRNGKISLLHPFNTLLITYNM